MQVRLFHDHLAHAHQRRGGAERHIFRQAGRARPFVKHFVARLIEVIPERRQHDVGRRVGVARIAVANLHRIRNAAGGAPGCFVLGIGGAGAIHRKVRIRLVQILRGLEGDGRGQHRAQRSLGVKFLAQIVAHFRRDVGKLVAHQFRAGKARARRADGRVIQTFVEQVGRDAREWHDHPSCGGNHRVI